MAPTAIADNGFSIRFEIPDNWDTKDFHISADDKKKRARSAALLIVAGLEDRTVAELAKDLDCTPGEIKLAVEVICIRTGFIPRHYRLDLKRGRGGAKTAARKQREAAMALLRERLAGLPASSQTDGSKHTSSPVNQPKKEKREK